MTKNVFAVSGMKCEHCKANVENALRGLGGVSSAEASLADGSVAVEYDEKAVTPEQLKDAVENSGRYEMEL